MADRGAHNSDQEFRPEPPNLNTVGEKSREAQNHGSSTTVNSQHNYQTSNATEPNQLAEMAAENLQRFEKHEDDQTPTTHSDEQGEYRQHDTGG